MIGSFPNSLTRKFTRTMSDAAGRAVVDDLARAERLEGLLRTPARTDQQPGGDGPDQADALPYVGLGDTARALP